MHTDTYLSEIRPLMWVQLSNCKIDGVFSTRINQYIPGLRNPSGPVFQSETCACRHYLKGRKCYLFFSKQVVDKFGNMEFFCPTPFFPMFSNFYEYMKPEMSRIPTVASLLPDPMVNGPDDTASMDSWDDSTEDESSKPMSKRLHFLFSCLGYSVGLGNIWRFPYMIYRNGGAFLLPFTIVVLVIGMPLYYLEIIIAQFTGQGPMAIWEMAPFFKGEEFEITIDSSNSTDESNNTQSTQESFLVSNFTWKQAFLAVFLVKVISYGGQSYVEGVQFFFSIDWSKMKSSQVWTDAAYEVIFSLGPCFGGLTALASKNDFHHNCYKEAFFAYLGRRIFDNSSFRSSSSKSVSKLETHIRHITVISNGMGLAFIVYPMALSELPVPQLWSVLFFLALFLIGLESSVGLGETLVHALCEMSPHPVFKRDPFQA
ncbi:Sodium-dependent serotonin transporter [Nymphon striatum]|nr:Sodium-dependent serotonin transporter [Nymphon striatum]